MLLGISIDSKLTFNKHISNICHNANFKSLALRRKRKYLSVDQSKVVQHLYKQPIQ